MAKLARSGLWLVGMRSMVDFRGGRLGACVSPVDRLLEQSDLDGSKCGARVSLQKVVERGNNSEETCGMIGQRIHGKLLRYTVPRASGKQSANVSG